MHIGLIGLGYWGKNILRNLYELGVIHIACDTDENIISECKKTYPDLNYISSYGELLKNQEIMAVVIAAPAAMHYRIVKESLLSGKDVFVEKPLAMTVKEGEELIKIAEKRHRILMVGHILQYHSAVIKLKELITNGKLGRIQYVYSNRLNIGKLRTEENILWSFAPHDISVILALLNEEPIKVSATGGDYLNKEVFDITLTTMEFKNGVKGHVFVSWLHPFKDQKLVVVGSKAMAVFDDVSNEKLFIYPHKIEWREGRIPVAHKADYQIVPVEKSEPLKEELKHFIKCVKERKIPRTNGNEGLRVLKILESAEKTLFNKQPNRPGFGTKSYSIHESSFIDENVEIGKGTKVWHFSHILKESRIGNNCIIGQNVAIGPEVTIGNNCKIQNNVSVYKGVILEDGVFCGPSCVFTNVYNPRASIERKHEFKLTLVKRGVTIGANSTILCGITIGEYAMIGAGAVVKHDIKDYAIVAGVPARQIGWACKCGTTLKFNNDNYASCEYCSSEYELKNGQIVIIKEKI